MADLLRAAEAASPRVSTERTDAATPVAVKTPTPAPAETSARAAAPSPDEASIFSRKGERRDSRGAVARAYALANGASISEKDAERGVGGGDAPRSDVFTSDTSRPRTSPADDASPDLLAHDSAAGVSVRRGGRAPAHPSATGFRLGHFLRSWQGSTGVALLLIAFGVAVFALVRGGTGGVSTRPAATPLTPAPQAAQQVPTPPAAQPTPALPTPDPLGVMPVTDPAYAVPYTPGQPYYTPQQGVPAPVQSSAPGDLTVVTEGGASSNANAGGAARRTEPNANAAAPARPETRGDAGAEADPRPARPARTPETEQQRPAPPPVQSSQPPPPAPQPTPARPKVIPWPPQ
jgi:hypothetical protein